MNNGALCKTCNKDFEDCIGHFGYIRLTVPIFHLGFFSDIVNILQCICKVLNNIIILSIKESQNN
jgi:DNA-directed RNA polymerase III subunit RPC1